MAVVSVYDWGKRRVRTTSKNLNKGRGMNNPASLFLIGVAKSRITGVDWIVIAIYFSILLCVAWWVVTRRKDSAADYFLAGRNLSWWIIGASIFASNIGSEHVVGLAGAGATSGVALAHYELHAWCLL